MELIDEDDWHPGDEFGYDVELPPRQRWEREQMIASGRYSENQIRALTYALKAEICFDNLRDREAVCLAMSAMELDPECTDAYRVHYRMHQEYPQIESDSLNCFYRELLYTMRDRRWLPLLQAYPGKAYEHFELQPYLRLLHSIAASSIIAEKYNVSLFALEEIIRTDHEDQTHARDYLIFNYLTLFGRRKNLKIPLVERTQAQLDAFRQVRFPGAARPLFDPRKPSIGERWLRIFQLHQRSCEWRDLAKAEHRKDKALITFVFEESQPTPRRDHRRICRDADSLRVALIQFPDLQKQLHDLLRGRPDGFDDSAIKAAEKKWVDHSRTSKADSGQMAYDSLEEAREKHRNGDTDGAIFMFAQSRRWFVRTIEPAERWYLSAPFSVSSNRATLSEKVKQWSLARLDTRFTLIQQPDHIRSYERLPRIVDGLYATDLVPKCVQLVKEVKAKPQRSMQEWRKLAARGIALTSLAAIVESRLGILTEERFQELIRVGIDDMYVPVNVGVDVLPVLPWLTAADMEQMP
jgi:hypothetical protein